MIKVVRSRVDPVDVTVDGPTRGASENASDSRWDASTRLALVVRIVIWLIPTVGAFAGLYAVVDLLYRPAGTIGLALWFVQGVVIGTTISVVLDRWARRLLPLVALLKMSMIFPDEAPSRFAVALRAGSFRRIERRVAEVNRNGLGADANEASAKAVELITVLSGHDRMTRGHTERVRAYADIIATEMGLSEEDRAKLAWGVMLHDIGKVTVPADVLNKTGPLTDTEWALLKTHPGAGGRLLAPLQDWLGPWARAAAEHHERWDGGGYPLGLTGEEISLAGRITAVADAYDVIISNRSYKKALSVQAARREMVDRAGSQFDPAVVRAFLNVSLGRRWTTGLLATFSNLPLGNLSSAAAVISAGIAASAASLVAMIPEPEIPPLLALEEMGIIEESTITTLIAPITTTVTTAPLSTSETVPTTIPSASTSTAPTTSSTTTQPTTASTTTTTATTTTTTQPTTASTTTTTATTTTTVPTVAVLYLKNRGIGDTTAKWNKKLAADGPDNSSLPNYNTDEDGRPGSRILPAGSGFDETDTSRIESFRTSPGNKTLSGPTTLTIWLATDTDLGGASTTVAADIIGCHSADSCTSIASGTATVSTWVENGFQTVTFDFGSPTYTFGPGEELVVRLITTGTEPIHLGFDADPTPSRLDTFLG